MKAFLLWYWLSGCLLTGLALGSYHDKCPKDSLGEPYDALASVMIWPAMVVGVFSASKPFTTECKRS